MKGWLKLVAVLVLAVVLVSAVFGCGGGSDSGPEKAVRGALKALEEMDAEKLSTYFTAESREDLIVGMDLAFALIDEFKIFNVVTKVVSQTEDRATVEGEWDIEITEIDETEKDHVVQPIELVKVDGEWLIDELSLFE